MACFGRKQELAAGRQPQPWPPRNDNVPLRRHPSQRRARHRRHLSLAECVPVVCEEQLTGSTSALRPQQHGGVPEGEQMDMSVISTGNLFNLQSSLQVLINCPLPCEAANRCY